MVIDYKMKLELGKRVREIQRDWYSKWEISLHGCYVVTLVDENQPSTEAFDLWFEDTKQDAFINKSTLDVSFSWLERVFPGYSVYLFSGMCTFQVYYLSIYKYQACTCALHALVWVEAERGQQVNEKPPPLSIF